MAFRFTNPLSDIARSVSSANRSLGSLGNISSALSDFSKSQKDIGRIATTVSSITNNAGNLAGSITNIRSAGGVISAVANNSTLPNTFRSVYSLTSQVNKIVPGSNRVLNQASTVSSQAEQIFGNVQQTARLIEGISGNSRGWQNQNVLDTGVRAASQAAATLGIPTGGLNLNAVTTAISAISNPNSLSTGNILSAAASGLANATLGPVAASALSPTISSAVQSITSKAPELSKILDRTVQVVTRPLAELTQPIGERYDAIRQMAESLANVSEFDQFFNNSFLSEPSPLGQFDDVSATNYVAGLSGSGASRSKIPNPLREFISYNYIITLGILSSAEYNSPSQYRDGGGFQTYVIKSAGGIYDKRYQVFDEVEGNGHAEYFIEDLELDAVLAPNPNTGVALGTTLKFTVNEPYSMGNFIEAIIGAAATSGFANYLDAPFCLRIDFVGWDEYGVTADNPSPHMPKPIFIPIKLTKLDFNVDGKGSVYQAQAVPMSETGLGDDINEIKTPINANGDFVHTVLETASRSVTSIMNDRIGQLENAGAVAPFDRYVIVFPRSREEFSAYIQQGNVNPDALMDDGVQAIQDRIGTNAPPQPHPDFDADVRRKSEETIAATVRSAGRMYGILKTFAEDTGAMNEIGLSTLVDSFSEGGNQAHGSQPNSYLDDGLRGSPNRDSAGLAPADKSRDYQFNQGMTITEVIERMVLNSDFARTRSTEPGANGIRRWFKIDTYTFIEENTETEQQVGRPPRVYVYSVIPYDADEAKFNAPNERPANTEGLKAAAAKEYNYIYTGQNEDVLEFDISFNNAFLQTAFSNFGQNTGGTQVAPSADKTVNDTDMNTSSSMNQQTGTNERKSVTGSVQEQTRTSSTSGNATRSGDIRRRIAEMFHDRITNQVTDMVTAEMQILGDPFFIPQEMGNFVPTRSGSSPNATEEGTMTYQNSEVFCVVNFKTPFDYQIDGASMEFPKTVPQFSGLFSVWAVTNNFSGGKFTQTLKMIRRRGQDDPGTTNNTGPIQENSETSLGDNAAEKAPVTGNQEGPPVASNPGIAGVATTPNTGYGIVEVPAAVVVPNPTGRRFGSIDQAVSAARAYQQANPGFTYAVAQGTSGGFTINTRSESLDAFGGSGAPPAPVAGDTTNQYQASSVAARAAAPRTPAC